VKINPECGTACGLSGFIITRGKGSLGSAISCIGASPTLRNCLIVGNRSTDANGAAAYFSQSRAVLANCTFADNYGSSRGAALSLLDSDVTVDNSILWGNGPGEMLGRGTSHVTIQYCCVQGGWPGLGNTDVDPLFAARGYWANSANTAESLPPEEPAAVWMAGDYHLKSQAGRWDTVSSVWLCDNATSPCIDAGNPASDVGAEPAPNGGVINLGAYGGTTQASKSGPAGL
jgi:hypothetical protein